MSYEGKEEFLCTEGHYWSESHAAVAYANDEDLKKIFTCPNCGGEVKYRCRVDETNGYDEEDPTTMNGPKEYIGFDDQPQHDHHGNKYYTKLNKFKPDLGSGRWELVDQHPAPEIVLIDTVEEGSEVIGGPYGNSPRLSLGGILNTACRIEEVPLRVVESFMVGSGKISQYADRDKFVGRYKFFSGIKQPLFNWTGDLSNHSQHHYYRDKNNKLKPKFRLSLTVHETPGLEVSGSAATPTLHRFLHRMLTNIMDDPCYRLTQDSGAFFQGGSNDPNGKWFLIEFWKPEGAQAFVDHLNEIYDPEFSDEEFIP